MKRIALLSVLLLSIHCGDDDAQIDSSVDAGLVDAGSDTPVLEDAAMQDPDAGDDLGVGEDAGTDAGPIDSWETFAQEFFVTYCVECHAGSPRDYRTVDDVRRDMRSVRCGVTPIALDDCAGAPSPNQFPVGSGPQPSDEDRTRLVDWINAGLL